MRRLLLLVLAVGGLIVLFLVVPGSDPLLDDLGVDLPETDLDPPRRWHDEKYRAVLIVREGEMEVRMSYAPVGGGRRTRILGSDEEIPWPVGLSREWEHTFADRAREKVGLEPALPPRQERPAVLLCADADASWNEVLRRVPWHTLAAPRIYVGARAVGGRVVDIPLTVVPKYEAGLVGSYMPGAPVFNVRPGAPGYVELQVTGSGTRSRVRWGAWTAAAGATRWRGDVLLSGVGADPLPGLEAQFLERVTHVDLTVVRLTTSDLVRLSDLIRVLRCARADANVVFLPYFGNEVVRRVALPVPDAGAAPLRSDWGTESRRAILNISRDRKVRYRAQWLDADELRTSLWKFAAAGSPAWALVRADEHVPWSVARDTILAVRESGLNLQLAFAPEEPGLPIERVLDVPVGETRVVAEPGESAGDVFRRILRQAADGAEGFEFE